MLFSHQVLSDSFATPWTIARQAPLFMGFSRQEYWSGWPCPSLGDLPILGTEPASPALADKFFTTDLPGKAKSRNYCYPVAQLCPTLCDPMDCSIPDIPVHCYLSELAQTHVHWVNGAIQPSHPLSSTLPPALNLSQYQGLFQMSQFFAPLSRNYSLVIVFHIMKRWTPYFYYY